MTTIVEDGDADIECDPSELALVLGDLVALASSEPREGEAASTQVRLRAGPRQITWEITGEQIDESGPTLLDAPFSLKDGALVGLTLARARLAVERHGGTLVYRLTDAGHFIQVTVPRRLERTKAARA